MVVVVCVCVCEVSCFQCSDRLVVSGRAMESAAELAVQSV